MQDDIRHPEERRTFIPPATPPAASPTPFRPLPFSQDDVDEQKLEQEFGQPQDRFPYIAPGSRSPRKKRWLPGLSLQRPTRRQLLAALLVLVVVCSCGSAASYYMLTSYHPPIKPAALPTKKFVPPPKTVASALSGLQVDLGVNNRPVTAVMIENSIDARPQSGLDQASIVFEALAEGGVTRFMALFQDTQPDYIGPVRSSRPYYLEWALGYDAGYAHVGGSPEALQDIKDWHVKDLDQFYNAGAYQRISTRYAPHNVYTSMAQLNQVEASRGYGNSTFTGFTRKEEAPSKTPDATSIDLTFSGFYYNAHFDYDAATNTYKRSEAGQPHMALHKDGSQVQIAPKVVVAMVVPEHAGELDSSGAYYADYASIGSGQVLVFQDGTVQAGTWAKASNTAPILLTDAKGHPLALNPGQTWISAMPAAGNITYK